MKSNDFSLCNPMIVIRDRKIIPINKLFNNLKDDELI